jgi:uncharacterized membrane protein YidH (DUF202 family)
VCTIEWTIRSMDPYDNQPSGPTVITPKNIFAIVVAVLLFPIGLIPLVFAILGYQELTRGNTGKSRSYEQVAFVFDIVLVVLAVLLILVA